MEVNEKSAIKKSKLKILGGRLYQILVCFTSGTILHVKHLNFIHLKGREFTMKRIFEGQSAFVKTLLVCISLLFLLWGTKSWAETYTGTLKYGDGLTGASAWKSSTLTWTVDDSTHPGLWTYSYSFTVGAKEISHVIIEVAKGFEQQNLRGGTTAKYELGIFGHQGKSNPGIPGTFVE